MRGHREHSREIRLFARQKRFPGLMDLDRGVLVIVEPGTLHVLVVKRKPQRLHEMQSGARIRTEANDVTRVGRNFRVNKNDVEHGSFARDTFVFLIRRDLGRQERYASYGWRAFRFVEHALRKRLIQRQALEGLPDEDCLLRLHASSVLR